MQPYYLYSENCSWKIKISTESCRVKNIIKKIFGELVSEEKVVGKIEEELEIIINESNNKYILEGRNCTYKLDSIDKVAFYLYRIIDKLTEEYSKDEYSIFHGGVMKKNTNSIAIIAPSMSGKSTLITYLYTNGYRYVSDDYIFVNRENLLVNSYPMPVSLRNIDVLSDRLSSNYIVASGYNDLKAEFNYLIQMKNVYKGKNRLGQVWFINRAENNSFQKLRKGELFEMLILNLKNTKRMDIDQKAIINICNTVEGYRLTYSSLNYAFKCIDSLGEKNG